MATTRPEPIAANKGTVTGKLDAAAWGLLPILANLGWGAG